MGEVVIYRSLTGYCYKAMVKAKASDQVTVDVVIPGEREPLRLSRIPLLPIDAGERGACFLSNAA